MSLPIQPTEGKPARISYLFMLGTLVLVGCFHLATPLLVAFFAYLALTQLHFVKRGGKWLTVALFVILVSAVTYGLGYFVNQTVRALPEIADKAIPSVIQWAREYQIELPFTDYDSLKESGPDTVKKPGELPGQPRPLRSRGDGAVHLRAGRLRGGNQPLPQSPARTRPGEIRRARQSLLALL